MRMNTEKYREITDRRNITNEEVCKRTGLSEKTLDWILMTGYLETATLDRIADAIGVGTKILAMEDSGISGENCFEFRKGQGVAEATVCQQRYINRFRALAGEYPDDCNIIAENMDGSIVVLFPVEWIKIFPPRKLNLTDEQREQLRENFKKNVLQKG